MGATASSLAVHELKANHIADFAKKLDPLLLQALEGIDGEILVSLDTNDKIISKLQQLGINNEQHIKALSTAVGVMRLPPFPKKGVSLEFILKMKAKAKEKNWTTTDLSENYIKPMTSNDRCSFEEYMHKHHLEQPHPDFGLSYGECFYDEATVFVSHAWRYQFDELVAAVETFTTEQGGGEWSYWLDLFVNDQWNAPNLPYEWWSNTFSSAIGQIGHTMLVLCPWDAPIPLTRAWCLWEILCTIKQRARLTVQLSTHQRDTFVEKLRTDYDYIMRALCRIDTQKSEAWNAKDREMIFAAVAQEEGGFSTVNNIITGQIRDWLAITARSLAGGHSNGDLLTTTELDDLTRAADLLSDQGKLEEARGYYEQAVAGYRSTLGEDDARTLNAVNNLAILYTANEENLHLARGMFERSLASKNKTLGFNDDDTLDTANNLGNVLMDLKDYSGAEELFNKTMSAYAALHGPESSQVASVLNNLGNLYMKQGDKKDVDKANASYEHALTIQETALGPDHPDTLSTVNNLANLLNENGKVAAARAMYERAYVGYQKTVGLDHPDTLSICYNLALTHSAMGSKAEAKKQFQLCYEGCLKTFGPDHDDTKEAKAQLDAL